MSESMACLDVGLRYDFIGYKWKIGSCIYIKLNLP